jgi:hypothetical protein
MTDSGASGPAGRLSPAIGGISRNGGVARRVPSTLAKRRSVGAQGSGHPRARHRIRAAGGTRARRVPTSERERTVDLGLLIGHRHEPAIRRGPSLTILSRCSRLAGRVQHVDRPAEVQALAAPARQARPRVDREAMRPVRRDQRLRRVARDCRRWRDVGNGPAARRAEAERAVGVAHDSVAVLVDRPVVPATEQREVVQPGRPAVGPVVEVMPLGEPHAIGRCRSAARFTGGRRSPGAARFGPDRRPDSGLQCTSAVLSRYPPFA